jgi:hypothetical protein
MPAERGTIWRTTHSTTQQHQPQDKAEQTNDMRLQQRNTAQEPRSVDMLQGGLLPSIKLTQKLMTLCCHHHARLSMLLTQVATLCNVSPDLPTPHSNSSKGAGQELKPCCLRTLVKTIQAEATANTIATCQHMQTVVITPAPASRPV